MTAKTQKLLYCACVRARVRKGDYTYFYNLVFPFFSISSHPLENHPSVYQKTSRCFMKNDTLFYGKQTVILWKTTRCFMENKPSFYEKRHVVLWKTSRHFIENDTSFYEKQAVICIVCWREDGLSLSFREGNEEGQKGRDSGMQDYLPPFILCGLLHLRSKNGVSPTERGMRGRCYLQWMVSRFSSVVPCAI